jgi:hypothetical protein
VRLPQGASGDRLSFAARKRRAARAKGATNRAQRQFRTNLERGIDQSFSSTSGLLSPVPRAPRLFFESPRRAPSARYAAVICESRVRARRYVLLARVQLHALLHVCAARRHSGSHARVPAAMHTAAMNRCLLAANTRQPSQRRTHRLRARCATSPQPRNAGVWATP